VLVGGLRARIDRVTPTLIVATVPRRATSNRVSVWSWGGRVSSPAGARLKIVR
jgi:hypothetical protein